MLDVAEAVDQCLEYFDFQWLALSDSERRLLCRFRQMTERERLQVRRLIEQLALHPDESET